MTSELAQWIPVAVIIAVMLYLHRSARQQLESRMDRMETRLGQQTAQVRDDLKRLDERVARLEHSQARLEGLLEGLRAAITRQPAA